MKTVKDYYSNRFKGNEIKRKKFIWQMLCRYFFNDYINEKNTVMDIGAGYCEFINTIKCFKKIAVDINPETKKYANSDVEVVNLKSNYLRKRFLNKVDLVFISNFLEHLNSKEEIILFIETAYKVLKTGGKIIVMQPNIELVKEKYWDFIDHKMPLTVPSVIEALEINNFKIKRSIKRFLPFTTKNNLPVYFWMIYLYLKLPQFLRIGAGQSLVIAQKI